MLLKYLCKTLLEWNKCSIFWIKIINLMPNGLEQDKRLGLGLKFMASGLIMFIMMHIKSWAVWQGEVMEKLKYKLLIKMMMILLKRRKDMNLMGLKENRMKGLLDRLP